MGNDRLALDVASRIDAVLTETRSTAATRCRPASALAMADQEDVRRIALSLPDTVEGDDRFAFSVMNKGKAKGFAWIWMERIQPKKPRVPNSGGARGAVRQPRRERIAARVRRPEKFFTEPHYNGFPAVSYASPPSTRTSSRNCSSMRGAVWHRKHSSRPTTKAPPIVLSAFVTRTGGVMSRALSDS